MLQLALYPDETSFDCFDPVHQDHHIFFYNPKNMPTRLFLEVGASEGYYVVDKTQTRELPLAEAWDTDEVDNQKVDYYRKAVETDEESPNYLVNNFYRVIRPCPRGLKMWDVFVSRKSLPDGVLLIAGLQSVFRNRCRFFRDGNLVKLPGFDGDRLGFRPWPELFEIGTNLGWFSQVATDIPDVKEFSEPEIPPASANGYQKIGLLDHFSYSRKKGVLRVNPKIRKCGYVTFNWEDIDPRYQGSAEEFVLPQSREESRWNIDTIREKNAIGIYPSWISGQ